MKSQTFLFLAVLVLNSSRAHADRGAIVVELGAGLGVVNAPAAHSMEPRSAAAPTLGLTGRVAYAVTPWLELGLGADLLPAASATTYNTHVIDRSNVMSADLVQDQSTAAGWLSAKLRLPDGFHPSMELGLGLMHHAVSHDRAYGRYEYEPSGVDQVLALPLQDSSSTHLLLAPAIGFEVGQGNWTVGFHARLLVDVATPSAWCLTLPLSFSWRQPL